AALDLLRELDLLWRRQQRVLARLAQEELQRVGRRLRRLRCNRGWGSGLLLELLRHELDAPPVELDVHGLDFERSELHRVEQLTEILLAQLTVGLGGLEQPRELLIAEDGLDLDGQPSP